MPCNLICRITYSVVYFLVFHYTNVVYDNIVHVHKNRIYSCVGGNHFKFENQIKVIRLKNINLATLNHAETRNRVIMSSKNIERMWFCRSFFVLLI